MSKDGRRSLRAVSLRKTFDKVQCSTMDTVQFFDVYLHGLCTFARVFFHLFIILSTVYIFSNKIITLSRKYFKIENCLHLHDNRTPSMISPLFRSLTIMSLYALFSFRVFAWSRLYAIVSSFIIVSNHLRRCLSKNVGVILVENEIYARKPVAYMN